MLRKTRFVPETVIAPDSWDVMERSVSPEENGSSRSVMVKVPCREINKRQLDPRIVTLEALLEQGITIEPGQAQQMLNLTDIADIEEYNSQYCESAYKFLQEHKVEIFKSES